MMQPDTPSAGSPSLTPLSLMQVQPEHKALDLAVVKKGAKDYLDFLDATKEILYGYLYHRTGSDELSRTLMNELYLDVLTRAMSLWWFGTLSLTLLLDAADRALKDRDLTEADIESVYLPTLTWLAPDERTEVATLHDALWSLPAKAQRVLILSILVGLSSERIAQMTSAATANVEQDIATAKDLLISRWKPQGSVINQLGSLVFVPAMDIRTETKLRFSVVEKYNALRFRRYQWAIIGGLFAVMSNVIVASVLAFAVIVEPPTSLKGVRTQVASLDATLLKRQIAVNQAKQSVAVSFKEAQRITAYDVTRNFTSLGLAAALESLSAQQIQEKEADRLIKLMQRAGTAMAPVVNPVIKLALRETRVALASVFW